MSNKSNQRELKKMAGLLAAGAVLVILFLIFAFKKGYMDNSKLIMDDYLILLAVLLYPLGIVYGWRKILNIALYRRQDEPDDRYYTVRQRNLFTWGNIFVRIVVLGLVICLGWILGVIEAIRRLIVLKSEAV